MRKRKTKIAIVEDTLFNDMTDVCDGGCLTIIVPVITLENSRE